MKDLVAQSQIQSHYGTISIYTPLSGSPCIDLPDKLNNPIKGLVNIKSNDNKCFLRCHIRHLNTLKINPERLTKAVKSMVNDFDFEGIKFPVSKGDIQKIEKKNNVFINLFPYENNLTYPVYVSDQKLENCMLLIKHNEKCLIINSKQSIKLKSGLIRFKNYFKQLAVPFKIYVDFECLLKEVKISDENSASYTEKYQDQDLLKLFALIIHSVKKLCFIGEKMQFIDSSKQFLKSMITVKN